MGIESVDKYLYLLSGFKLKESLKELINRLEQEFILVFENSTVLSILVHTAYLIERLLLNGNELVYPDKEKYAATKIISMKNALSEIENQFSIHISEDECRFMLDIIYQK
ncbi:hypothetical protein A5886_001423 [Enterococcus sp. 8G7_MSG3316]|uniref:PRD domain-containing protein n=2 Tax=Candidatus Enterococcus testudinis TaxID=1834191 RepID=A0A242A5N3_9ENTE|nr:hypothetical protein A5886_001423 [Enterococcus sp. 8G7_MSG3316]